jgi:dTDP-4-dehydrorhamnose reductase
MQQTVAVSGIHEEKRMKSAPKALVLGGHTGLLGQALMDVLIRAAWCAVALGRRDGQILDVNFLARKIKRIAPDVIFNAIAWTHVDMAEEHPAEAMSLNRGFVSSLVHSIRGTSIRLVQYSTDFVFNGAKQSPYTTEDAPKPESVYGMTKLAGEQALTSLPPEQYCIMRTAWLFGPGRKNFVSTILNACLKRDHIEVVHDQTGSPTYTRDLAQWSLKLAELEAGGIFHAVNGGEASWCDLACEAVNLTETPCRVNPIRSAQWPQKAKRPHFSVLDTNCLTRTTGIVPRPWPLALREYLYRDYLPLHS